MRNRPAIEKCILSFSHNRYGARREADRFSIGKAKREIAQGKRGISHLILRAEDDRIDRLKFLFLINGIPLMCYALGNVLLSGMREIAVVGSVEVKQVLDLFPKLGERRGQVARTMSGGEQQMVAIGRALMSRPETILLDEPSMGLAPQLVEQIFEIVKAVNEKEGVTFLLAEQNTNVALRYAHYGYILESGRVVMDGPARDLRENPDVKEFYLGMSDEGRKSFRDVRSYRRRKRWLA